MNIANELLLSTDLLLKGAATLDMLEAPAPKPVIGQTPSMAEFDTDESVARLPQLQALEDRAAALDAESAELQPHLAEFGKQESALFSEIDRHKSEIRQLLTRLDAVHAERSALVARIESLRREAERARDEAFEIEAEMALAILELPTTADD